MAKFRVFLWMVAIAALLTYGMMWLWPKMMPDPNNNIQMGAGDMAGHKMGEALSFSDMQALGGDFTVQRTDGTLFTQEDLKARPSAMFFGYANCPDVCPTTLFSMTEWIMALGDSADKLQFLFFTVDPERDTPEMMEVYMGPFSDKIIPLTGTNEQIQTVIDAYKIYVEKRPILDANGNETENYLMGHSSGVMLFQQGGEYHSMISFGEGNEVAVQKITKMVE